MKKWLNRIKNLEDDYWMKSTFELLITYFLSKNKYKKANEFYEIIDNDYQYNYPRICAWQNLVSWNISSGNFNVAKDLFNNQNKFPDPDYFPVEDILRAKVFLFT